MKKLILSMTIFLVCFWLFGHSEFSIKHTLEKPMLTFFSNFTPSASFSNQVTRVPSRKRHDWTYSEFLFESNEWARVYGDSSTGYADVHQTTDGGYVFAGNKDILGGGSRAFLLVKVDSSGEPEWGKTYGSEGIQVCTCVTQTSDEGYLLAGFKTLPVMRKDFLVIKLDSNGKIQWQNRYPGRPDSGESVPYSILEASDGRYILVGASGLDLRLLMLYPDGTVQRDRLYPGGFWEVGKCVRETSDGGFVVLSTYGEYWTWDYWLIKTDFLGEIKWQKRYGGNGHDSADGLWNTNDGGYIIAGFTNSFGDNIYNGLIIKLSSNGEIEWQKVYEREGQRFYLYSILQTIDGSFIAAGKCSPEGSLEDIDEVWLLKLSPDGNTDWLRAYGYADHGPVLSLKPTLDKGYVITATTESFNASKSILGLKFSPNGKIGPSCNIMESFDVIVSDVNVYSQDTKSVPVDIHVLPLNTDYVAQDAFIETELLCWDGHQPPENISLTEIENRSLFRKEFYNKISWDQNPYNNHFNITEYRIYRRVQGLEYYSFIVSVPSDTFEYRDGPFLKNEKFDYVMTSVDTDGHESLESKPVGNQ